MENFENVLTKENEQLRAALRNDPALSNLLSRMPDRIQHSFSEEQLSHLKVALSARSWGSHIIDFRSTISFFSYRYYYVFVAGRNRRELTRADISRGLFWQSLLLTSFLTFSAVLGVLVLYLVKSALGIDLFPNFSLGIWSWFKETFQN